MFKEASKDSKRDVHILQYRRLGGTQKKSNEMGSTRNSLYSIISIDQ